MLIKLNMILKMRPIEANLDLQLTANKNVMKGPRLEFLFRILACKLTLR